MTNKEKKLRNIKILAMMYFFFAVFVAGIGGFFIGKKSIDITHKSMVKCWKIANGFTNELRDGDVNSKLEEAIDSVRLRLYLRCRVEIEVNE